MLRLLGKEGRLKFITAWSSAHNVSSGKHRKSTNADPRVSEWKPVVITNTESLPKETANEDIIWNPCNIQLIPDSLHSQIFIDSFRQLEFEDGVIKKCQNELESHSLWGQQVKPIAPVNDLVLPKLKGEDINEHFRNIALQQTFRYKRLLDQLLHSRIPEQPTEWKFTKGWTKYMKIGTLISVPYPQEDALIFDVEVCVPFGNVPTLACALSTEAWYSWCSDSLINGDNVTDSIKEQKQNSLDDLIPLETVTGEVNVPTDRLREKIVVGHNVSYDRARIKEQYFLTGSKARFIDTMSLHIAVSGITSYQRALKLTAKSGMKAMNPLEMRKYGLESTFLEWHEQSSLNNLADVYKLYCHEKLDKESRDVFVKGSMEDIRQDFQNLCRYCANDVAATKKVYEKLLPMFFERFPHPVTLAGTLEMGTTYLPINSNWKKYIENSEKVFNEYEMSVKSILMQKANEALKLLEGEKYKDDPWLWDLDWKVPKKRKSKSSNGSEPNHPNWYRKLLYKKTDEDYMPGPAKISTSMQLVPKLLRLTWLGFPLHYSRKGGWGFLIENKIEEPETSLDGTDENTDIITDQSISVMDTTENEKSLFPHSKWLQIWEQARRNIFNGGTIQSPTSPPDIEISTNTELRNKSEQSAELKDFIQNLQALSDTGLWSKSRKKKKKDTNAIQCSPHPKCLFIPLPHKDGPSNRVGNPLAKDFLAKIEEGILTSADDSSVANKVVRLSKMISYWKNNRDRILGQMSVWFTPTQVKEYVDCDSEKVEYGAILPQVAVSGTLTRRAVEPTWMTASNAYEDRIGSELKGMVQVPPSFYFVGADVDSQELWIASIIGDASFTGIHGSTALGWMTLQGNKNAGTDMHSKTASVIGMGRDQAKVLNYARIYGAGVSFAERLIAQFNKQLSATDAKTKAKAMYKMTKGERKYMLNQEGRNLCDAIQEFQNKKDQPFSKVELRHIMGIHDIPPSNFMELVEKMVWDGGTESHMFNRLEDIAQDECPKTPFLGCSISRSLIPSVVHNDFMTSRVNWVVQSSAVDYLHLMVTCMRWLNEKYNINARFAISVHDEVRYIVSAEDRYRAALALQITNLLTRSFCAHQLNMKDLPMSVAFFSCIDIDKVLRKEVTQDCVTPSNPKGLSKGYGIPLGEGLNMTELMTITKGSLYCATNK